MSPDVGFVFFFSRSFFPPKFYFMHGLVVPHSDVDVQGTSHCWSCTKHFGHYDPDLWQLSAFRQLEGSGKRCQPVVERSPEQNDLKGINVYMAVFLPGCSHLDSFFGPQEGSRVQGCFTGQPRATDFV